MNDLENAKKLLEAEGYTCVLCKADRVYTSRRRGVAPLLELLDSGDDLSGFCAADKVIGKATALLYVLMGVKHVYGAVISSSALQVLQSHGITVRFGTEVPCIVNRAGDGRCPMETATASIDDPRDALSAIRSKLAQLRNQ